MERPRVSKCDTTGCGRDIRYVTGRNYGRWVHSDDGRWQCANYGLGEAQNNQARPPMEYYTTDHGDQEASPS